MLSVIRLYLVLQLANCVAGQSCTDTKLAGTNCTDGAYKIIQKTSEDECCAACAADPECVRWSYAAVRVCWLSRTKGTANSNRYLAFKCGVKSAAPTAKNIVELAQSVPSLSTLVTAVVAGDLATTLSGPGPFTVFAPTNDGFGKLPKGTVDTLLKPENKDTLVDILTYHVLPTQVLSKEFNKARLTFKSVEGQNVLVYNRAQFPLPVDSPLRAISVAPAGAPEDFHKVTKADNKASNGVVHIIDGVLLPPTKPTKPTIVELAETVPALSTLVAAVVAGDLADTLSSAGPFTVFAPTNDAFAALGKKTIDSLMNPANKAQLVDILTYHVLPEQVLSKDLAPFQAVNTVEGNKLHIQKWGGEVRVGSSLKSTDLKKVTAADNLASNGVAHIIDGVLLPPASPTPPASKEQVLV